MGLRRHCEQTGGDVALPLRLTAQEGWEGNVHWFLCLQETSRGQQIPTPSAAHAP